MDEMSEFRAVYLEELEEQLQCVDEEVLRLEQEGQSEEAIGRLFRAAHTLKGSSAAMGYEKMKQLTHEMEHLLDKARHAQLPVTPALTELFFKCLDGMKRLQDDIIRTYTEQSDMSELIGELRSFEGRMKAAMRQTNIPALPSVVVRTMQDDVDRGQTALRVSVGLEPSCQMKQARLSLIDYHLQESGSVYWSDADINSTEGVDGANWLLTTPNSPEELNKRLTAMLDVANVRVEPFTLNDLRIEPEMEATAPDETAMEDSAAAMATTGKEKSKTIRVQVERLENMMNLVGELVIAQSRLQRLENVFHQKFGADESVNEFAGLTDHLNRTITDLQENVMKVRMLPIEQLFNRFPRMVRDLAQTLQKEVELIIEGKETELDRNLIEDIGDPLIHLIRNAVDHGIEKPDARKQAGKRAKGTLRISASHEDNQVLITIADDGAGIDPENIRRSAIRKGIIDDAEAKDLPEQDIINLIFHPGFSTAARISDVSGRGVGMDIVRTEIERMNGLIQIETSKGEGTLFRVRLPLTLAVITGLLVEASGKTYIIPMSNVAEIKRIELRDIRTVRGAPVVALRQQIIPLVWLSDYFGSSSLIGERAGKHIPVVIVGRAEKRLALAVDGLIGNQEIVIKSLGSFIGKVEGISGGTILPSGQVGLILEIGGIISRTAASV